MAYVGDVVARDLGGVAAAVTEDKDAVDSSARCSGNIGNPSASALT